MKKLILALVLFASALVAQAQYTQPRWGTRANGDNGAPGLFGNQIVFSMATGVDTVNITPAGLNTIVRCAASQTGANVAINDSVCFRINTPNPKRCYLGDRLTFLLLSDASVRKVKFTGTAVSALNGTTTASKYWSYTLIFNGAKWVPAAAAVSEP